MRAVLARQKVRRRLVVEFETDNDNVGTGLGGTENKRKFQWLVFGTHNSEIMNTGCSWFVLSNRTRNLTYLSEPLNWGNRVNDVDDCIWPAAPSSSKHATFCSVQNYDGSCFWCTTDVNKTVGVTCTDQNFKTCKARQSKKCLSDRKGR